MKKHILIIEDDRDILDVLKDLLESEGYQISTAENGRDALDFLEGAASLPDLMLVDLMMPVMDGYQFREIQSKHPRFKKIPLVLMSADGHIEAKKAKVGVEHFMQKPLALDQVLETVATQSQRAI